MAENAQGSEGQSPEQGLARDLSELARDLQIEQSSEALVQRIADAAASEVDGVDWAAISEITSGKEVVTRGCSGAPAPELDQLQYEAGDGPCLTSLREQTTVRSDDLTVESRWPRFAQAAAGRGVRSMLSVQLYVDSDNLGALNLYSRQVRAFDEHAESTAMLLASHAAIAMKRQKTEHNLRTALESRDTIGQAKGVLMERYKIGAAEAFDLLVLASQRTHRKLRDIADELTQTGELRID